MFGRTTGEHRAQFGRCSTTPSPTPNTLHLPASSHHATKPPNHTRTHPPPPPPSCSFRLLLIVTQVPTHASDASNNNPTTINPPLGAVNVPISTQAQAMALVDILHTIRATRGNGVADWHPKAIEKTLFTNKDHPAPYGDIVVALTKYARDSDKHVPNFLFDALADWAPKGQTAQRNPCLDHQTRAATNCPDCWSEVKTGMRPAELVGKHHPIPDTLETAMSRSDQ